MKIKGFIHVTEVDKSDLYIAVSDIVGIRSVAGPSVNGGTTTIERKSGLCVYVYESITYVAQMIEEAAND